MVSSDAIATKVLRSFLRELMDLAFLAALNRI